MASHLNVSTVARLFFLGAGEPTDASWACVAPAMAKYAMDSMKNGCFLMDCDGAVDVVLEGQTRLM